MCLVTGVYIKSGFWGFNFNYFITNYFCGVRLISLWMIFHVHAACVRLNYCSCQSECQANVWLLSDKFPVVHNFFCLALMPGWLLLVFCCVRFLSGSLLLCPVDVRPTSGSNVWLCLGPCLARHFLTGIILWQYIFNVQ